MKWEKNYLRKSLKDLIGLTDEKPIVVSGRYKAFNSKQGWVTFTCIRPYIPDIRTFTVCDHVNIREEDLQGWLTIPPEMHNRKFYLVGRPYIYFSNGNERGGLRLAQDLDFPPIFPALELLHWKTRILEKCHMFDSTEWQR
ncbi:MAG: hypothetical protein QM372_08075 [Bacillota bacterium]|jgi:hypothetical protein|nr:hypothetical protein [Bacillota bacterium]